MFAGQSLLGLVVSGIYLASLSACILAAVLSRSSRTTGGQWLSWAAIAALFALLIVLRAFDIEDTLRDSLREYLRGEGAYEARREVQRPILAGVVILASAAGFWLIYRIAQGSRGVRELLVQLALIASAMQLMLLVLRIISLHQVDAVLYGPFKMNWIIDVGASLGVLVAALLYGRSVIKGRQLLRR